MSDKIILFLLDEWKKLTVADYEQGYCNGMADTLAFMCSRGLISAEDATSFLNNLGVTEEDFVSCLEWRYESVNVYVDEHPEASVMDVFDLVSEADIRQQYLKMKAKNEKYLRGIRDKE